MLKNFFTSILLFTLLSLTFVGCTPITNAPVPEKPGQEESQDSSLEQDDNVSTKGTDKDTPGVKEFELIARQWEFEPNTIIVSKGDLVKIKIKNIDVAHGIAIKEFGVSEKFNAGEEVSFEFIADKVGEFAFYCNVLCGPGHSTMNGKLIVK